MLPFLGAAGGAAAFFKVLYNILTTNQDLIDEPEPSEEKMMAKISDNKSLKFYVIEQDVSPEFTKRSLYTYDRSAKSYVELPVAGGVFGPNIRNSEVRWEDESGNPVDISYQTLFDWNWKSYRNFVQDPAVRFVRQVASKLGFTYDWKKLFENPSSLLTKYLEDSQPTENLVVFNSKNLDVAVDRLIDEIESAENKKQATSEITRVKELFKNKVYDVLEVMDYLDRVGQSKRFVAREIFLTSIFHSPFVVFEPVLQGAIDRILFEIRSLDQIPPGLDDKLLFIDLINSPCSIIFAETVGDLMIYSNKSVGLSTPKNRLLSHNLTWIQSLNRLRKIYVYKGHVPEQGTENLHSKLSQIKKPESGRYVAPKDLAKSYVYIPEEAEELSESS